MERKSNKDTYSSFRMDYNYLYSQIIIWSSIYSIVGSMLPVISKENDLNKMLRYIKNMKQK